MYILNISRATKKMLVIEVEDFIFENYYKLIAFSKKNISLFNETLQKKRDLLLLANKLIETITDPRNAKEYYQ